MRLFRPLVPIFVALVLQIDPMRVESVVRGYAANAAEILPLQRPAKTLLPPLLYCMACEMLNVRLLAPEVQFCYVSGVLRLRCGTWSRGMWSAKDWYGKVRHGRPWLTRVARAGFLAEV